MFDMDKLESWRTRYYCMVYLREKIKVTTHVTKTSLYENLNNKNSVKWNNDVKQKEFTASRINQLTWDDASGRLKVTLDGNTVAYIPVVYN